MIKLHPVILCGGSGTRLWPLSREDMPKQSLGIIDDEPLITKTVKRFSPQKYNNTIDLQQGVICCGVKHRHLLRRRINTIAELKNKLLCEPEGRNTAAAMAAAVAYVANNVTDSANHVLAFMPADHLILNDSVFTDVIKQAAAEAHQGKIVTIGATAKTAHTGYGYIRPDKLENCINNGARPIVSFIEKPDLETAQELVAEGICLWNCGMFLATVETLIAEFRKYAPQIYDLAEQSLVEGTSLNEDILLNQQVWQDIQSISFDYAIMEKTNNSAVVEADFNWADLGGWESVLKYSVQDEAGNSSKQAAHFVNSKNCYVGGNKKSLIVLSGVEDIALINTPDAILVTNLKDQSSTKNAVTELKKQNISELIEPARVERPWGTYEVIDQGEGYQVKRLEVFSGGRLSLQYHHHRSEHWHVVAGVAEVTVGEKVMELGVGESVDIALGQLHRLANNHNDSLILIEVQRGKILREDDIVRVEDVYNRT